jgi:hypothetical protein
MKKCVATASGNILTFEIKRTHCNSPISTANNANEYLHTMVPKMVTIKCNYSQCKEKPTTVSILVFVGLLVVEGLKCTGKCFYRRNPRRQMAINSTTDLIIRIVYVLNVIKYMHRKESQII